jgi:hypothetical protein
MQLDRSIIGQDVFEGLRQRFAEELKTSKESEDADDINLGEEMETPEKTDTP